MNYYLRYDTGIVIFIFLYINIWFISKLYVCSLFQFLWFWVGVLNRNFSVPREIIVTLLCVGWLIKVKLVYWIIYKLNSVKKNTIMNLTVLWFSIYPQTQLQHAQIMKYLQVFDLEVPRNKKKMDKSLLKFPDD